MIEKMNAVYIVSVDTKRAEMLDALRDLGVLHLGKISEPDENTANRFTAISKLSSELREYAPKEVCDMPELSEDDFEELYGKTVNALKLKAKLETEKNEATLNLEKIKVWGEFYPESVKQLKDKGIDFHFYRLGKKEYAELLKNEDIKFIRLKSVEKLNTVAVIGSLGDNFNTSEFILPDKGVAELEAEIKNCESVIRDCIETLKNSAKYLKSYSKQLIIAQNNVEYSAVENTIENDGKLIWISGYIPQSDMEVFTEAAKKNNWAWYFEEAKVTDELVPTKIKYNKLTALVKPVFEILGTVPGYGEYDISFWFLTFFSLFFAMIIGDAGYGVIFLIAAIVINLKIKKVNNAVLLLYVLSASTVVWGALTGTWFGLKSAMDIPFLKALVIPSISNYPELFGVETTSAQNAVMKFCFSIGAIQLALACIMNIRRKITEKNLSFISDIGWLLAVCALYFTVLYLVIGQKINIVIDAVVVGVGFLLVVIFGGMSPDKTFKEGLKAGLADTFTTFLNTISAFGNVMSYIRLFAVGMASLAIAQSFNDMASGFDGALLIVGAVIMIIGHLLNIVMGFLSVVVHGVRLNLLEFSGQLGMEWSGTAYEPFRKRDKLKK